MYAGIFHRSAAFSLLWQSRAWCCTLTWRCEFHVCIPWAKRKAEAAASSASSLVSWIMKRRPHMSQHTRHTSHTSTFSFLSAYSLLILIHTSYMMFLLQASCRFYYDSMFRSARSRSSLSIYVLWFYASVCIPAASESIRMSLKRARTGRNTSKNFEKLAKTSRNPWKNRNKTR